MTSLATNIIAKCFIFHIFYLNGAKVNQKRIADNDIKRYKMRYSTYTTNYQLPSKSNRIKHLMAMNRNP